MSSVLLIIPLFLSLNNQIRNTVEMGVYSLAAGLYGRACDVSAFHTFINYDKYNM
jgi:hypothetical protein